MAHCILHIGTRKTGSTSLQKSLSVNKSKLKFMNFYISSIFGFNGWKAFLASDIRNNRAWYYKKQIRSTQQFERKTYFNELKNNLKLEINENLDKNFIFSVEDFSLLLDEEECETVKSLLEPFDKVTIFCYLRRQDEYVNSDLTSELMNGRTNFFNLYSQNEFFQLNYFKLLSSWTNIFGEKIFA